MGRVARQEATSTSSSADISEVGENRLSIGEDVTIGSTLGEMLRNKGKLEEAEPAFRRTFISNEEKLGPDHPRTLTSISNLADVLRLLGQLEEAEGHYRRALKSNERELGPEHPSTLASMNNLALSSASRANQARRSNISALPSQVVRGSWGPSTLTRLHADRIWQRLFAPRANLTRLQC